MWGEWIGGLTVVDGVEEICALFLLFDVSVDEQRICLGVNILHHDLEAVEATCFGDLDFAAEALDEVLVDNTIRGGEKGEHVGDEVALIVIQAIVPVVEVFREVDFFSSPERSFGFFIHAPDLCAVEKVS